MPNSKATKGAQKELLAALENVFDLDMVTLTTYTRLWQLETWLRRMVYVELKAKYGALWDKHLRDNMHQRSRANDEALTHMPSSAATDISYLGLSGLVKTIDAEWDLFESYLKEKTIWDADLMEVEQIRHRVAHFRRGHRDDLARVTQLLRDIDKGCWMFCTSLNNIDPMYAPSNDSRDPVIYEYSYLIHWAQAHKANYQGPRRFGNIASKLEISIEVNVRPWNRQPIPDPSQIAGTEGFLYSVVVITSPPLCFRYDYLLETMQQIRSDAIFYCVYPGRQLIRVILPTVVGKESIIEFINILIHVASESLIQASYPEFDEKEAEREERAVQQIADRWSDLVFGPDNPITFLTADSASSLFNA